jgi:hypothetical protein
VVGARAARRCREGDMRTRQASRFGTLLTLVAVAAACSSSSSTSEQGGSTATGAGGATTTTTGAGGAGGAATTTTAAGGAGGATTTAAGGGGAGVGGGGGAGGATQSSPCGPVVPPADPYASCTGDTFFPDGSCLEGSCATDELASKVFAAWKSHVLATSGLDEATLWDRVAMSAVEVTEGPVYVWVRLEYVITYGWLRSRQSDSVNLGSYPLPDAPSAAAIAQAVKLAVEDPEWKTLGALAEPATLEAVEAAVDGCSCAMTVDYCHVDFENVTGKLTVDGRAVIDAQANQCKAGTVDVTTGQLTACLDVPCGID